MTALLLAVSKAVHWVHLWVAKTAVQMAAQMVALTVEPKGLTMVVLWAAK